MVDLVYFPFLSGYGASINRSRFQTMAHDKHNPKNVTFRKHIVYSWFIITIHN